MPRRGLHGHQNGPAPFAAQTQTLRQTADDQQNRGPDADLIKGGNQADGASADAHDVESEHKHFLAPEFVAEMAENDPAQGSPYIAHRKGSVRKDCGHDRIEVGKIQLAENKPGHGSVQKEVVPFEDGSHKGGCDGAFELPGSVVRRVCLTHRRTPWLHMCYQWKVPRPRLPQNAAVCARPGFRGLRKGPWRTTSFIPPVICCDIFPFGSNFLSQMRHNQIFLDYFTIGI